MTKQTHISGAEAVVASLEAEGVDLVFGYPGGQAIAIYDALFDAQHIHHVLARHEQGAVHEADGYARATGRAGVVLVTSGPGATNTVTGIATAYMDSVPLIIICAQVPRGVIGTDSFQEADIVGITMPVVKHSYLVQSATDLPRIFKEAFHIALTGRPGPVLIDIPSDVAAQNLVFSYPSKVDIASYKPTYKGNARQVRAAAQAIKGSVRPIIYAGGGIISSGASQELLALVTHLCAPVVTSLMAKGALPAQCEFNLGPVGMHGSKYANSALNESDLIIALGTRFSDRVTGKLSEFAPDARVIHIDIDPAEISKVRHADVPIVGDVSRVLTSLLEELKKDDIKPNTQAWLKQIKDWKARFPMYHPLIDAKTKDIVPELVLKELSARLDQERSIVVTDVGQHQMWAAQYIDRSVPRSFLSSGGLGTMGFGLPAAIGASLAKPDRQVICISGDGSFQMCMQEMATAIAYKTPVKMLLLNNNCLGMVHQWQKFFYRARYSATILEANPDFALLARAYGWQAQHIEHVEEVQQALDHMLGVQGPYLLDVAISPDQNVYPMVAPGKGIEESLGAIDIAVGAVREGLPAEKGEDESV